MLYPFSEAATRSCCDRFYHRYYADDRPRHCILGINPGRFGGGVTGIPFTDPIRLQEACGIDNDMNKRQELSSAFVYDMIREYGGPESFYGRFYITSVSPVGFVKDGKNMNYYDDRQLMTSIRPYAVQMMWKQLRMGMNRDVAFCFGDGKNHKFLAALNAEHGFFGRLVPLPHPRYIMQYQLRHKQDHIRRYLDAFRTIG